VRRPSKPRSGDINFGLRQNSTWLDVAAARLRDVGRTFSGGLHPQLSYVAASRLTAGYPRAKRFSAWTIDAQLPSLCVFAELGGPLEGRGSCGMSWLVAILLSFVILGVPAQRRRCADMFFATRPLIRPAIRTATYNCPTTASTHDSVRAGIEIGETSPYPTVVSVTKL
jgi:hypothetical protein